MQPSAIRTERRRSGCTVCDSVGRLQGSPDARGKPPKTPALTPGRSILEGERAAERERTERTHHEEGLHRRRRSVRFIDAAVTAAFVTIMPDQVPVHFTGGEIDRIGSRFESFTAPASRLRSACS